MYQWEISDVGDRRGGHLKKEKVRLQMATKTEGYFKKKKLHKNEVHFPDTVLNPTFGVKESVGCKRVRTPFQIREHAQIIDTCLDDDHVGT